MSNATLKQPWSVDAGMGLGRGRDRSMHDPAPAGTGQGIFHAVRGAGHLGSGYRRIYKASVIKTVKGTICTQMQSSSERRGREEGVLTDSSRMGQKLDYLHIPPGKCHSFLFPFIPTLTTVCNGGASQLVRSGPGALGAPFIRAALTRSSLSPGSLQ